MLVATPDDGDDDLDAATRAAILQLLDECVHAVYVNRIRQLEHALREIQENPRTLSRGECGVMLQLLNTFADLIPSMPPAHQRRARRLSRHAHAILRRM